VSVKAIFDHALELPSAAARQAYLDEVCGNDPALRQKVEALLKAHDEAGSFLQKPVVELRETVDSQPGQDKGVPADLPDPSEALPSCIGPYKLLEQIGEGGFGVVFMAEQQQPIRRKVALKILKPGMDSKQVIARFEAERQALALMDHPNIARVLDAGTTPGVRSQESGVRNQESGVSKQRDQFLTPDSCPLTPGAGRPYFVMELVKGIQITEYCDENRLTPRERLPLFIDVCQAVQHAHQKGIIHRDIKPSNVLVTLQDGRPLVKVIDFGIAKALGQQLTDKTLFTGFAQLIGTPLYMSPEQAALSNVDVDTRSDIYSLGVLLYELLTGTTPFEKQRLKEVGFDELRRIIREEEPPKPSTRISTLGKVATTASSNRRSDPRRLSQLCRGELDWVVMKALDKDRNRRYETASAFAADVQRYLNDEPVSACPPSASYRLRKFARRHKSALAVAGLILFFVALLGGGSGWFWRDRAARAQEVENKRLAREAEIEHDRVARLRETGRGATGALTEYQQWLDRERLPEATAAVARAETLVGSAETDDAIRVRVQEARRTVNLMAEVDDARFYSAPSPAHQWQMEQHQRFDKIFRGLGIDVDALNTDEAAARIKAHPLRRQLAAALDSWSSVRLKIWWREKQRGDDWRLRVLVVAKQADPDAVRNRVREALINMESKSLIELAAAPDVGGLPAPTVMQLALALYGGGSAERKETAIRVLKEGHAHQPDHFGLNMTLGNYLAFLPAPRYEEALAHLRAARAIRTQNRQVPALIGEVLIRLNRADEALPIFSAAIDLDPNDALAWSNRGAACIYLKRWDQTIADCSKAIELDRNFAHAWVNRSNAYFNKKSFDKARDDAEQAIKLDPNEAKQWDCRGHAYSGLGKWEEALASFTKSVKLDDKQATAWAGRARAHAAVKQYEQAAADYSRVIALDPKDAAAFDARGALYHQHLHQEDRALADFDKAVALDDKMMLAWLGRGLIYRQREQWQESLRDLSRFLELAANTAAKVEKVDMAGIWFQRGICHDRLGHPDKALRDFSKALDLDPKLTNAWANRGWTYSKLGKFENAVADYSRAIEQMPKDPDHFIRRGVIYCDCLKKYDQAIEDLSTATGIDPKNASAHYKLGCALQARGRLDEAIKAYQNAVRLKEDNDEVQNALGNALFGRDRMDEAIDAYQKAIRIKKNHASYHFNLGNALVKKSRLDEAIKEHREAIRLKEDFPDAYISLGVALTGKGRLNEAIDELQKAIRLKKNDATAHYNLGRVLHGMNRLEDAIAAYQQAVRLQNNLPGAQYALGNALFETGQTDKAIAAYQKAIQLKADDFMAHNGLGNGYQVKGLLDEAITEHKEAIRLKPDCAEAHNSLGVALAKKNRLDEAVAELHTAIRLKHNFDGAHVSLGNVLHLKGQPEAAIAEYRKAIAINKNNSQAHYNLANVLREKGLVDDAIAEYRQAIRIKKDDIMAHNNLAEVLRAKDLLQEAVAEYREVVRINNDDAPAHCNLGHALRRLGEFREALRELRRGHELGSRDPGWRYPSAKWVQECQRLVELDQKLPAFITGETMPTGPDERIELARLCSAKRLHRAVVHFYVAAFATKRELADDLDGWHRYNAACAAALAGCGAGKDVAKLDRKERAGLRHQALNWLQADLEAWRRLLDKEPDQVRSAARVSKALQHWLTDSDLAGVRGPAAVAQFPDTERQPWHQLWGEVADTLARARGKSPAEKK
jgi:tetratricopeptide (TPR) repeat protein/serine/threonine protein kinase